MRLREKLQLHREVHDLYVENRLSGRSHDECCEVVAEAMQEKYGASLEWGTILKIIMLLLSLLETLKF